MEVQRENIFTQLARDINLFWDHHLTKVDLYEKIINYIEMADKNERKERENYKKKMKEYPEQATVPIPTRPIPYSNYEEGKKMLIEN